MNFEKPRRIKPAIMEKKPKEQLVVARPTKPMTTQEILDMMEKEGLRPATHKELMGIMEPGEAGRIKPREDDIIVEGQEVTHEEKRLPSRKE